MIRAIGWEVRLGQQFRSCREFISLNVRMVTLYYHYVIIYAYSKKVMLVQRSSVTLFDAYQSKFLPNQIMRNIRAIGREVRFGQHFRRYRELTSLSFRMLLLCYHYIIVNAVFTKIMLLQRRDIIWFYDFQSLSFPLK